MVQEIVVSPRYGGFRLSDEAKLLGREISKNDEWAKNEYDLSRDDPVLIEVVKQLGTEIASGNFAKLCIATIPDCVEWEIKEYDGLEWVAQIHQTWGGEIVIGRQTDGQQNGGASNA